MDSHPLAQGRSSIWPLRVGAVMAIALCAARAQPFRIEWSWGPVMPVAKSCRATTAWEDSIYTVGGTYWEAKTKRWSSAALRLDLRDLAWSRLPDYPVTVGYASAVVVSGRLFIIGGRSEIRGNREVFALDLSAKDPHWREAPSLPRARWGHAGAAIGGVIYVAGGSEGESQLARDVLALDVARPERGWQVAGPMPATRNEWQAGAACAGKLYLFGGLVPDPATDKGWMPQAAAFVFDPQRRAWEPILPLPEPLGSGAATAIDKRFILIAGGYALAVSARVTPDGKARTYFSSQCLLYDTVRGDYWRVGNLNMAITDEGLVCVRDTVVAIGGEDAPYQTRTDCVQMGRIRRRGP